ncbi:MAG: 3-phosphoserine/phosphohydroxythreonine transaminase [Bacteroidetes bacterium]|nr:MAG: 3-phosphoserine/phosphohydroxythreonine transaminase [Bacteroidota bacterium]
MSPIYNFSAGPAVLPQAVLEKAQAELVNYQGSGMSIMEMSHRGKIFSGVRDRAEAALRELMAIPDSYAVLFLQGGASSQFSMVPLNLTRGGKADYVNTGAWSKKAIAEAKRYTQVRVVASSEDKTFCYIPALEASMFDPEADYVHITTNNTIYGTVFPELPPVGGVPLVADMSSNILSQVYRVEDFGLIYAGAQKNIGPAGVTIVIVRRDLLGQVLPATPKMFEYQIHADNDSMYNTPPTYGIYMAGLVFEWVLSQGGVAAMEARNREKAALLYDFLDGSELFSSTVQGAARSIMNVPFLLPSDELNAQFIAEADAAGLKTLKGHRSVGGMRASIYNAMPREGVVALVDFMKAFEAKAKARV